MPTPTLRRRLASLIYELFLLAAIFFAATLIFILLFGPAEQGWKRTLLQVYLFGVAGAYFVWCWSKTGQTLAMKTWRVRLVNMNGLPLSVGHAIVRYILATMTFGACFVWALFDRDRQFLHDHLLGTRLVKVE